MALTPSDVEQKTFATAFKGYDLAEVDDFLDEIVATIRDLEDRLAKAQSGAPVAPAPIAEAAPAPAPTMDESAIGRALLVAQQTADRIVEEARAEAERIKAEAKAEADSWESDKAAKKAEAEAVIATLNEKVANVRRELAVLVNTLADGIDEMDRVLEEADTTIDAGGIAEDEIEVMVDDSEGSAESVESEDSVDSVEDFEAWEMGQAELDQATT